MRDRLKQEVAKLQALNKALANERAKYKMTLSTMMEFRK